jgi:hypothetical protein
MIEAKPSKGFRIRLRDWLRTAGLTSGVYFFSGVVCPCCGSTCPVGFSGAVLVGNIVAFLKSIWHSLRLNLNMKSNI